MGTAPATALSASHGEMKLSQRELCSKGAKDLSASINLREFVRVVAKHTLQITIVAVAPPALVAVAIELSPYVEGVPTFVYGVHLGGKELLCGRHGVVVLDVGPIGGHFGENTADISLKALLFDRLLEILFRWGALALFAGVPKIDFQKFRLCHSFTLFARVDLRRGYVAFTSHASMRVQGNTIGSG